MTDMRSQTALPYAPPAEVATWERRISQAFSDAERRSGFYALAKPPIAAFPGDPVILRLAAAAAVLDEWPVKALLHLDQFCRRYMAQPGDDLLRALALNQAGKPLAARALLRERGLTQWRDAYQEFVGDRARVAWLATEIDTIMGRVAKSRPQRPPVAKKPKVKPKASAAAAAKAAAPDRGKA